MRGRVCERDLKFILVQLRLRLIASQLTPLGGMRSLITKVC